MQIFSAHMRFDPSCGERWTSYIQWSGYHQLSELVSIDDMLCPRILEELIDDDWQFNIHADFKTYFFTDVEYLKRRIGYDPARHNLLSLVERPDVPTVPQTNFELCGYDILDSYDDVSVLTNCGGFPSIFDASEVNHYGLLDSLTRALDVAAKLRDAEPNDPHCGDCRVWSICRYAGAE